MINNEIKAKVVNVVNEETKSLTQMSLTDAIKLAEESDEDVICINDKSDIPIVKIADYNKYIYEKNKRDKENKKKTRLNSQDTKEIQISDVIAEHDLKVKAKNVDRLINEGNKVRLIIKYRGRSIRLINQGPEKLHSLVKLLESNYKIDKEPIIDGSKVLMIVAPNKK